MKQFQSKLDEIRKAIQMYVAALGIAKTIFVLSFGVWVAFFLDYLPVFFGFKESPWYSRLAVILVLMVLVISCLYHFLIRNLSVRIGDDSLRLLIERSRPDLDDRLLTTSVGRKEKRESELSDRQNEMLLELEGEIEDRVSDLRAAELLKFRPLVLSGLAAALPVVAFVASLAASPDFAWTGLRRNLLLSDLEYPRRTEILTVFFRAKPVNQQLEDIFPGIKTELHPDDVMLVGQGSSIELEVEIKSRDKNQDRRLPESCRLYYQMENGQRGNLSLSRKQRKKNGVQVFSAKDGILNLLDVSGTFWLAADDAVNRMIQVQVVEPPTMASVSTDVQFPGYLIGSSAYENGRVVFVNDTKYPERTRVTFDIEFSSENLKEFRVWNEDTGKILQVENDTLEGGMFQFSFTVSDRISLGVAVKNDLGIISREPVYLSFDAIKDEPPTVNAIPVGIGQAITRNAVIPIQIEATDEFGVKDGSLNVTLVGTDNTFKQSFDWDSQSKKTVKVDLLELRRYSLIKLASDDLTDETVIKVSTFVSDFNPVHQPANGQEYDFQIVDEKKLVQIIEKEEASLRKRLESISVEFGKTRALCLEIRRELEDLNLGNDQSFDTMMENAPVFVQRIRLQTQKSSREIVSVANSLQDLIQQLQNNRMTVKLKQVELSSKVEQPLRDYANIKLADFQSDLVQLSETVKGFPENRTEGYHSIITAKAKSVLDSQGTLLMELNQIILQMVKFESQSELLESVRNLIEMHKQLMKETMNERERKIFDGILD